MPFRTPNDPAEAVAAIVLAGGRRRHADAQAILSAVEARIGTLDPWRDTPGPHTETGASA